MTPGDREISSEVNIKKVYNGTGFANGYYKERNHAEATTASML